GERMGLGRGPAIEIVSIAMRRASIASTPARAASRSSASVAGGSARSPARAARKAASCGGSGRASCQSSQVVSSNVACAANSATGNPAIISSPRSPSTWLRRVAAATTPSRPVCTMSRTYAAAAKCVNVDPNINMSTDGSWMSASDACRVLRITPATLYAYVSRGFVRSEATRSASRQRRYSRDDVERLRRRKEGRRDPDRTAAETLRWGLPILESAITLIADNTLFYRGHDAVELARTRSVAEVAALIWTGTFDDPFAGRVRLPKLTSAGDGRLPFTARAQRALAVASAHDHTASDLRAPSVALTGWRILWLLTSVVADAAPAGPPIEQALAHAWRVERRGLAALRAALIVCADHELNVSSFTARCVASAGSTPYA